MPLTLLLSDSLKAKLLTLIDADIASGNGEYARLDRDKVAALPVGTRLPLEMDDERADHLAWYPEDMTGEEIAAYLWEASGLMYE